MVPRLRYEFLFATLLSNLGYPHPALLPLYVDTLVLDCVAHFFSSVIPSICFAMLRPDPPFIYDLHFTIRFLLLNTRSNGSFF
jgi:hypothetical protein